MSDLAAEVAVEVMGWHETNPGYPVQVPRWYPGIGPPREKKRWRPHEDIAQAWEVVEELRKRVIDLTLMGATANYAAEFVLRDGKTFDAVAPTAPQAICQAALAAVRSEG